MESFVITKKQGGFSRISRKNWNASCMENTEEYFNLNKQKQIKIKYRLFSKL